MTNRREFQKIVIEAINATPFKNKTIVFRIGEILLRISEQEEAKKAKKDQNLLKLIAETLRTLAKNINEPFNEFMDKLIDVRNKIKGK